jgi:hypothetical protein
VTKDDYEEDNDQAFAKEDDTPWCAENPTEPVKACKVKEGDAELTCTHVTTAWCLAPSRNPGQKYRAGAMPLCCDTEQTVEESNMADVSTAIVVYQQKVDHEDERAEPPAPVPTCAVGHTFEVDSFESNGKTQHRCRDSDNGRFANKLCCSEAFKLMENAKLAEDICPTVPKRFCKTSSRIFEGKRNKFPNMPDTHTCKRMYMCSEGRSGGYGPVPNQSWCTSDKTGFSKNLPARRTCVAVKK